MSVKSKLNPIEVLISKALIDSNVSHDEFVLMNNLLKKIYDIKKEMKNSNNKKVQTMYEAMLSYCLKCRKYTERTNCGVVKTKNGRIMLLSNFSMFNSKKSKFLKKQQARRLLSSFEITTPLSQIPMLGSLLF